MKPGRRSLESAGCSPARRLLPFYVNGSLEGEEAETVRSHLETCAACRRDLGDLLSLARAVEMHGAADSSRPASAPVSGAFSAKRRATPAVIVRRASWLAAAAVLVLIAASLWPFLRGGAAPSGPPAGPYVLDLGNGPERGDAQLPVLASRLGDRSLTLVFFVPVSPESRYSADLVDPGGRVLAHAGAVGPPDPLGRISWTVPTGLRLSAGEHEVTISRTDQAGDRRIYRYAFRVDVPSAGDDPVDR